MYANYTIFLIKCQALQLKLSRSVSPQTVSPCWPLPHFIPPHYRPVHLTPTASSALQLPPDYTPVPTLTIKPPPIRLDSFCLMPCQIITNVTGVHIIPVLSSCVPSSQFLFLDFDLLPVLGLVLSACPSGFVCLVWTAFMVLTSACWTLM